MEFIHSRQLTIQDDLISKLGKTSLVEAVVELIWNSLDADALNVYLSVKENVIGVIDTVSIVDDGTGISFFDAKEVFKNLGGSKKKNKLKTDLYSRFLHGKEGKGRLKALSIGALVTWNIIFEDNETNKKFSYSIQMDLNRPSEVKFSEPKEVSNTNTGVRVEIVNIPKSLKKISKQGIYKLNEIFSFYLHEYEGICININGKKLDPKESILSTKEFPLDCIEVDGKKYSTMLEVTEWNKKIKNNGYLCCNHGFPYSLVELKSYPNRNYTAYIKSEAILNLLNTQQIEFSNMNSSVMSNLSLAEQKIKAYFRELENFENQNLVAKWKKDDIYPYSTENPNNVVEAVERQIFNILASSVSYHIDNFNKTSYKNKKFQFKLLKQALESCPDNLRIIMEEVLTLTSEERQDFVDLLKNTTLSSIINASKVVADRLNFINGLENIINDKSGKKHLKERSQLHRLLVNNCWIFGDEFFISVDDQSLTECLKQHKKVLSEDVDILESVEHPTKNQGIVDLMLSKATRQNKPNSAHHLIIELKRPSVKIGRKEIEQILDYSDAIMSDARFSKTKAKWTFIAISLERDVSLATRYTDIENGILNKKDNYEILVKTWAEIFDECKARLQFFQERLNYKAKAVSSFEYINKHFPEYIEGINYPS